MSGRISLDTLYSGATKGEYWTGRRPVGFEGRAGGAVEGERDMAAWHGAEQAEASGPRHSVRRVWRRWLSVSVLLSLPWGCEYTPTKSQYVSAVVREKCADAESKQDCRIAVIKSFSALSLEQIQEMYPPPEKPVRPSCSL